MFAILWTVKICFPTASTLKQVFFLSDFLLYHYSKESWLFRFLDHKSLYTVLWKIKKRSRENKNKLRTIYPKSHGNFNNSKPRLQFYWFLYKKSVRSLTLLKAYFENTGSNQPQTQRKDFGRVCVINVKLCSFSFHLLKR